MSWHTRRLVGFDLETTGTDPNTARIVTAAVIWVDVPTSTVETSRWLTDPGIEIPQEATAVHGVTTEYARSHGAQAIDVVPEVHSQLRLAWEKHIPVVAFNATYDFTLLDRELRRHGMGGLASVGPIVDPLVIDRAVDRYRKGSRKLAEVCRHYGVTLANEAAHTSEGDALAAARLAWCLGQRFPELAIALDDLQALQAGWHAAWASSFQQYLRTRRAAKGASAEDVAAVVIDASWPLQPLLKENAR